MDSVIWSDGLLLDLDWSLLWVTRWSLVGNSTLSEALLNKLVVSEWRLMNGIHQLLDLTRILFTLDLLGLGV